eukprot:TRINITY_DN11326_c0_g1_i2.p1 TRINITY_DN11326_c0_g1~~TRINITY_DN11326_c0_g1_i2.p1  ORF type:complete len:224 (-),score=45.19 TRINITY_DN11326_c0_g1_i2:64-735(-)
MERRSSELLWCADFSLARRKARAMCRRNSHHLTVFIDDDQLVVADVHNVAKESCLKEIFDRHGELVYKHHVWRMEHELKDASPALYDRLLDFSRALDAELWEGIEDGVQLYPEIEYIVYDVKELGEPGNIEPHTDNFSQVSVVVLLSDPRDFEGGINFFEPGVDEEDDRCVRLGLGDAVFFYGDKCEHWISPVTAGRRTILQMELSNSRLKCGAAGYFGCEDS